MHRHKMKRMFVKSYKPAFVCIFCHYYNILSLTFSHILSISVAVPGLPWKPESFTGFPGNTASPHAIGNRYLYISSGLVI